MSRPTGMACGLVLALLLCAGAVHAQTHRAQAIREQTHRVDSLVALWKAAEARLQRFDDSIRVVRLKNDTVIALPLRILVQPELRQLADSASRFALDTLRKYAGRASARLDGYHVVVGALAPVQESGRTVRVGILGPAGHEAFTMGVVADPVAVGDAMSTVALRAIGASVDQRFRAWIGEEIRWDSIPTAGWVYPRMNLVSLGTEAARACYEADMHACAVTVLGGVQQYPYPSGLRGSLVRVAMQLGGDGAFERFVTADGTPAERLTVIARAPTDTILRAWHTRIRNAGRRSVDMNAGIAAMSVFWILVCGALSLRSSRWR